MNFSTTKKKEIAVLFTEKTTFNYSSFVLSEVENSHLLKDLNLIIPPKKIYPNDHLLKVLNYFTDTLVTLEFFLSIS